MVGNQKASRMALTTLRANSSLTRSTALVDWLKNTAGSTAPEGALDTGVPVASISSRTVIDGLLHSTLFSRESRSSIFAVTVIVYRDACCWLAEDAGRIEMPVMVPTSTASAPVVSGTIL